MTDSSPESKPLEPTGTSDQLQKRITDLETFVKLVAENLRYGSWTKRFVTVAGVVAVLCNPISAGTIAEACFGVKALPKWYFTAFWGGLSGLGAGAIAAAVVTLPKPKELLAEPQERQAIKGLRSFELEDADIFSQLQRSQDIQDCYRKVTDSKFRLGVVVGESGCGKSSLLQAGLLPRLLGETASHRGAYVKMGSRPPLEAIRAALGDLAANTEQETLRGLLAKATQSAGKPIVLLLDQFEQFFVQYSRPEDRAEFIQALKAWYESEVPAKVLVGIRGDLYDRLIEIQESLGFSLGPEEVIRLKKFSPTQAVAVLKVMATAENLTFDDRFMTELAKVSLASPEDGLISPVDVQVLAWMIVRQSDQELRAFNQSAFQKLGGVDGLLQRFLERTLELQVGRVQRELSLKVLLALTDRERQVRAGTLTLADLQTKLAQDGSATEVANAVQWLTRGDVRLVTQVEQDPGWAYELTHERLIPALLRVAGKELSEAERANQLLDRRVNEWLGNGCHDRYLFDWRELRLLQRQRHHLTWGTQRQQKAQLWRRSQRRMGVQIGAWATPVLLLLAFWGWSNTTPGQLQWVRWQLMVMSMAGVDIYSVESGENLSTAFNLDMVAGVKHHPLPRIWLKWFAFEAYSRNRLAQMIQLADIPKLAKPAKPAQPAPPLDPKMARQLLKQVEIVAQEADFPNELVIQVRVFSQLAQVYHTRFSDDTKARQLLNRSLAVTKTIPNEYSKADALMAIAQAHITLQDSNQARQLLEQALEITKTFQNEYQKAYDLRAIAQAYITLKDGNQARQLLEQALELTKTFPDAYYKVDAFRAIAEAYITLKDGNRAGQLLGQALNLTKTFQEESRKADALKEIAQVATTLPDSNQAWQLLEQSLELTKMIQDEDYKATALGAIAQAYITLKDNNQARQLLGQALELTKTFQEPRREATAPRAIAQAYITLPDNNQARQLLGQVLNLTKTFPNEYHKATVLREIAQAAATLLDRNQARQLLAQALELTNTFPNEYSQARTLRAIAQAYITLQDSNQAQQLLGQSLELTKTFPNEYSQVFVLGEIAQAAATLPDRNRAGQLLEQALELTKTFQDEERKAEALVAIAQAYIQLGEIDRANEVLQSAHEQGLITESVVLAYAELGKFGKAYHLAQRLGTNARLRVFARILTVHAEQQNPELKQLRDAPIAIRAAL